jgi:thiamine biosynthesis lipoprotein
VRHPSALLCLLLACRSETDPATKPSAAAPLPAEDVEEAPSPSSDAPFVGEDGTVFAESELMGTRVSMRVWLADEARAADAGQAIRDAFREIARIESIASEWQADSELTRLNESSGSGAIEISPELFEILERSRAISEATHGSFDVSFHAVGQLWKFGPGSRPPSPEAIAEKLPLVNWRNVELLDNPPRARLVRKGMKLGLGAIAKGYAVDAASRLLTQRGFAHHIVEGGGDTYARGSKDGQAWQIGVQHPTRGGAIGAIAAKDRAVVTSGNYMRFFEWEGRRYTHILDPQTGWPISADKHPKSVTCVAPNATDADAYCTAVTIMGRAAAMSFVGEHEGLDVVIIDFDDSLHVSEGLSDSWRAFEEPSKAPAP